MEEKKKIQSFTDLNVWQEAHKLVLSVYKITRKFAQSEVFGLTSQMRRAAVSITSNIAEGFSRHFSKEKIQFYSIAHGSLTELQNQLLIARDVGYLDNEHFHQLSDQSVIVHKLLNAFIKKTREFSFSKFQIQNSKFQSGQGLLEVVLAIAVFGAIAGVLITMAVGGFRGLEQGGEQTEAEAFAQEGIEAVQAVRNKAWNENIATNNQTARVQMTGCPGSCQWQLYDYGVAPETCPGAPTCLGTNNKFRRTITFNNVCRDATDVLAACPASYTDPHTKEVVSAVSWLTRGGINNTVEKRAYISNWDSKDRVEDTTADFGDGTFPAGETAPSTLGDGTSVTLQPL